MTTRYKPKLSDLARQLLIAARATGEDRSIALSHGARLAYRVRGGKVWCSVARKDKRLGDTELVTFRAQCGVPAAARRIPDEGQKERDGWFQVGWVWEE